jgi:hypothetical protein
MGPPMTDEIMERVARAICRQNLISTRQPDDAETMEHYWKSFLPEADAALSALGWREMVEAMETANKELSAFLSADDHARDGLHLAYGSVMAALRKARGET